MPKHTTYQNESHARCIISIVVVVVVGLTTLAVVLWLVLSRDINGVSETTTITGTPPVSSPSTSAVRHSTQSPTAGPWWPACARTIKNRLNKSADPCAEFYEFACGGWVKNHPLSGTQDHLSIAAILQQTIDSRLLTLLSDYHHSKSGTRSALWKATHSYRSCISSQGFVDPKNQRTLHILKDLGGWPIITKNWTYHKDFSTSLGRINEQMAITPFFQLKPQVDPRNPTKTILFLEQGNLILSSPRLYNKGRFAKLYEEYLDLLIGLATLLGGDSGIDVTSPDFQQAAAAMAENVYDLESDLGSVMETVPQLDTVFNYNLNYRAYTFDQLRTTFKLYPDWDWETYFLVVLPQNVQWYYERYDSKFVSYQSGYLKAIQQVLRNYDGKTVTNYLFARIVLRLLDMGYIQDPSGGVFYEPIRNLQNSDGSILPKSKDPCLTMLYELFSSALTGMYAAKYPYTWIDRSLIEEIISKIKVAFKESIDAIDWLDTESKTAIQSKLQNMAYIIGYPHWITNQSTLDEFYVDLVIEEEDTWLTTFRKLNRFGNRIKFELLNSHPSSSFPSCTLLITEPYYQYTQNYFVVPLSMMNVPFYDPNYPKAVNYGALGWYMAESMAKGFTGEGIQFDETGALRSLLSAATMKRFSSMTSCLINQYDRLCEWNGTVRSNGTCADGLVSINANLADNFASRYAAEAYGKFVVKYGREALLPGMTEFSMDQIAFVAMAANFCENTKASFVDEEIKSGQIPKRWGLNAALRNSELFSAVYNCKPGSSMNPVKKCKMWQ